MNFALFGRFFLEFAMMYPAEYLCLASLQEHLRAPRKTYAIGASAITLMGLAGAAVCCMLDIETNFLLIPLLIISFWLLRWRTDREVSISQTMFLFSVSAVMMSVCTLLAVVLNAEAELDNAQPVFLPSTSVICLTLAVILSTIFRFTAVRWSRWLLQEYHGEAFWESAWPLPALYAGFQAPARRIYADEAAGYLTLSSTAGEGMTRLLAPGHLQLLYSSLHVMPDGAPAALLLTEECTRTVAAVQLLPPFVW